MKLKIERIAWRTVMTKKGQATVVDIFAGGKRYSCFENPTSRGWAVGQEIEVEVKQRGNYWNIVFPREQNHSGNDLIEIKDMLEELLRRTHYL